ncbi:MAG: molybdenum cofactor guanylyltransferase [Desulfobacteraceae bacterium]|nr:molybdenum cofactor guanylyltransferase [Desulfobacteraceae bacterium]
MKDGCTGVILAGGRNSRLPGEKKGFRKIGGKMIIDRVYQELESVVDEIIIVTNDPIDFSRWDAMIVSDIDHSRCALAGLHAGIYYASYDKIFITACDTPFIRKDIIEYIISFADKKYDVIIPETEGGLEALLSVYSKACLPLIEKNLKQGLYMIKKFYSKNKVKTVPLEQLREFDPLMESFFNVNTPEDFEKANSIKNKRTT